MALAGLRPDALEELWLVDLPADRADAPEVWDQAVQLLSAATLEAARSLNRVVVTQAQLASLLELHGAPPVCLPVVFDHLVRTGSLRQSPLLPGPVSPFGGATPAGSSGFRWAVDTFWTTLGYAPSPPPPPPVAPTTPLVLPPALRTAADAAVAALAAPTRIEAVTSLAAVAAAACGGDLPSAAVVVDHLANAGKAALQPDVPTLSPTRGVKFCDVAAGFTSVDASVLALKAATTRLDALDASLAAAAATARSSAKAALAAGNTSLAKRYLRREAGLRARLDANAGAGANLAAALSAVDTADGNRETVAALAAGNAALKELSGPGAPTAADVDALAVEFGELADDVDGVSAALAQGTPAGADADADAEAELEAMEAAMAAEHAAAQAAAEEKVAADAATAAARARRAAAAKAAAAADADAADAAGRLAAEATAGVGSPAAGATGGAGGMADNAAAGSAAGGADDGDVDDLLAGLDGLRVSASSSSAAAASEPDKPPRGEGRVQVPG